MSIIAPRMRRFKASASQNAAMRARAMAADGIDVINLTIGQPDFPPPDHVRAAAEKAMAAGVVGYTNRDGIPEFKEAIRRKFSRENGLEYAADEVLATTGAKAAISCAFLATLGPGDEVILPTPFWGAYEDLVRLAGGVPVPVSCPQQNGFRLLPEDLEATIGPKTKWLSLNSPSNPSGAAYSASDLTALAEVLARHPHVHVMADDIYEHLLYTDAPLATMANVAPELFPRTLTINGVSKAYSMTGFRVGFAGGPRDIVREMGKLQGQLVSCPNAVGQHAALAALDGPKDIVEERRQIMRERRDLMVAALNDAGLPCHAPEGAMYVYPSVASAIGCRTPSGKRLDDDTAVTDYLVEEAHVAVVQGASYGLSPHVRVSYAAPLDRLEEAGRRIATAMAKLA